MSKITFNLLNNWEENYCKRTKIKKKKKRKKKIGSHAFWISSDLELYQVALECIGYKHTALTLNTSQLYTTGFGVNQHLWSSRG